MSKNELKIGQVSNRLIKAGEFLLADANRMVLHEPMTRSEQSQSMTPLLSKQRN
ncbi:hypothetical protein [Limosilactobacillus fermentum]|uniref:hypothetical protein n=1 Tax=Limosilactobacillus fermentum TaxID=1613 RepID=UPI0037C119BF